MTARPWSSVLALLVVLVVGAATTAWGYFSAAGSGSGAGASGATAASLVLTAASPTSAVHPGGQASVAVTVTNPNSAEVRLASLVLDTARGAGGFTVDAAHASCSTASLSFAAQSNGGTGWTLAGNGSTTLHLGDALGMGTGAADACQGASFTVHLKAGP